MPKKARELSAYQVRRLKRPGLHAVGGVDGLCLNVKASGARSWIQRVMVGGRRREVGLGAYPTVTLEQARERGREVRGQAWEGIDPVAARRAAQDTLRSSEAKRLTFDQAAKRCHQARIHEFRSDKHKADWISSLERYASPVIGRLPIANIEIAHVVAVLEPIWAEKTETATRVRQRAESVLAWATTSGYRAGDNPARWKGHLEHVLPKPAKLRKVRHHPALPWERIAAFMADLRGRYGTGARALEFAILTAARSGEIRFAQWDEIDLAAKVWTVPADRMKAGLRHRVPLSAPAVNLLKAVPRMVGVPFVFPAPRGGALSDMSISAVTRRMHEASVQAGGEGYLDPRQNRIVTPHGFRSSFKDWARSATSYADEVSELALAHVSSDDTRAAYARDELLPKRERLMRDWAKFCGTVQARASVTPIRRPRG